jgi:acyl-CoA thioesterase
LIFDPQEQFTNSRGEVHGGVVATLLDAAMAVACRSSCGEGAAATTVSMTVNYLRPAQGRLYARGRTVRSGSTLASMEASVADESGAVVAQAIGTMRIIRAKMNAKEAHPLTDGSGPS